MTPQNTLNAEAETEAEQSNSRNTYSVVSNPEFRKHCDALLDKLVADSFARHDAARQSMNAGAISRELFIRSTIESVVRIEMMRKINPLVCNHVAAVDPILCKQWGLYAADEGLHGRMFAKDLKAIGLTEEEIFSSKPLFSTELLAGYLYQTLADEGPLAVVASAYYVESIAAKTQPAWLDAMEKHVGAECTRGSRAHLRLDEMEGHVDLAWNMCMRLVKTPEQQQRFIEHLIKLHSLLVGYMIEVYHLIASKGATDAKGEALVAMVAAKQAGTALAARPS
jgi:hypothetical protein